MKPIRWKTSSLAIAPVIAPIVAYQFPGNGPDKKTRAIASVREPQLLRACITMTHPRCPPEADATSATPMLRQPSPTHLLHRDPSGAEAHSRFSGARGGRKPPMLGPLNDLRHLVFVVFARLEIHDQCSQFGHPFKGKSPDTRCEGNLATVECRRHIRFHLTACFRMGRVALSSSGVSNLLKQAFKAQVLEHPQAGTPEKT